MGYASAVATAKAILGAKGKIVTLTRMGQGSVDPISGIRTAGGSQTSTFNCVGLPPGRSAEFQVGSLINRRITMFYMARLTGTLDPTPGDIVPWGGKNYTLIWSAVYDPDDSGQSIFAQAYGEIA